MEVADEFITSKSTDLTHVFITDPRHPGRLKNRSGWKKTSVGACPVATGGLWWA